MTTNEMTETYRLPGFANLSGAIATIGLLYLAGSIIFIVFLSEKNQHVPFLFLCLSASCCFLGGQGLLFSQKKYVEDVKNKKITNPSETRFEKILLVFPLLFIYFDKNAIEKIDIKYIIIFCVVYILLFCYAYCLMWYKKNYYYHAQ